MSEEQNTSGMHEKFTTSCRPHALFVSNHGVHDWQVTPGLADTGGQNVFINSLSQSFADLGFRVTIANRGGYPHPITGHPRDSLLYRDEHQRIVFLQDSCSDFVHKENMGEFIPELSEYLARFLKEEAQCDLLISHYWDGACIAKLFKEKLSLSIPHIWVPHSLGKLKAQVVSPEEEMTLRLPERIRIEEELFEQVDYIAATSQAVRHFLEAHTKPEKVVFLPPCVNQKKFFPRSLSETDDIWLFISNHCGLTPAEVRQRKIILEISRTVSVKRKDVLIRAFARVHRSYKNALLVLSIQDTDSNVSKRLRELISELRLERHVAVVGSVREKLPKLFAAAYVYCSPSVMEDFGMAVQEAAASGVPSVASSLIPFAVEYLAGPELRRTSFNGRIDPPIHQGDGTFLVRPDYIEGYASALLSVLHDEELREQMAQNALHITVPFFTWERITKSFLEQIHCSLHHQQ